MGNIHMKKIFLFSIDGTDIYFEPTKILNCSIEVRPVENFDATFHPATITYTGVSVGGIHTGGFHTTEAHYSYKSSLTGRGRLIFRDYDDHTHSINSIMFSREISAVAEKVLDGFETTTTKKGTIYHLYSHKHTVSAGEFMSAMTSGNGFAQANIVNRTNQNYAYASKCEEMGVFLLRVIHGEFLSSEEKCESIDALLASYNSLDWLVASNVIRNPINDKEKQKVALVEEKLREAKFYRLDNRVFESKSVYTAQAFKKSSRVFLIPACIIGAILLIMACTSTDLAFLFIVSLIVLFGAFIGFSISSNIKEPSNSEYYDC